MVFTITFLFFTLVSLTGVNAGFNCVNDPDSTSTPPTRKCIEGGGIKTLKECLVGIDGQRWCGTPECDPPRLVDNIVDPCKDDPRYQLRNFGPMLNFPTIGSMLNLGTGLVTVIAGLLCGVFMFLGVFNYMTAGGDQKKLESARLKIVFTFIGLLIVLFAYTIVKLILDTTSTNTVGF